MSLRVRATEAGWSPARLTVLLYVVRCVAALGVPLLVGVQLEHTMSGAAAAIIAFGAVLVGPVDPRDESPGQRVLATAVTASMLVMGAAVVGIPWLAVTALAVTSFAVSLVPAAELRHERSWFYATFVLLAGMAFHDIWPGGVELVVVALAGMVWAMLLMMVVAPRRTGYRPVHRRRTVLLRHHHTRGLILYRATVIAAVCAACLSLSFVIGDRHVGWITVAALATLQPDPRGLAPRLFDRLVGTVAGAVAAWATLSVVGASPARLLIALLLAGVAAASRLHHYRLYVALITTFVLTMSGFITAHEGRLALDRVLDTVVGATAAAVVYWLVMGARRRHAFDAALARARRYQQGLRGTHGDRGVEMR